MFDYKISNDCRFVVGPYEEKDYSVRSSQAGTFYRQVQNIPNDPSTSTSRSSGSWRGRQPSKSMIFHLITQALRVYKKLIQRIKCCDRHHACPHPFSCLYYTLQVSCTAPVITANVQIGSSFVFESDIKTENLDTYFHVGTHRYFVFRVPEKCSLLV